VKQRIINWLKFDPLFVVNSIIFFVVLNQARHYLFVHLEQSEYFESVFVDNLISEIPWFFVLVIVLLVINYLPTSWNMLKDKWSWHAVDDTGHLRVVMMIVAFTLVWSYSAYSYNFYYDQPHYLERLLLVLSFIGCWFSPLFIGPMVVLTYTISGQMTYPEEIGYTYTDKLIVFQFLIMFAFYVFIRPITRPKPTVLIFVTLCLVGAFYFYPAHRKLEIGTSELFWIVDNDLHNLYFGAYLNGWLSFLPLETAYSIRDIIEALNIPLQFLTMLIEIAGIVIVLFNRRIAMLILLSAICMHVGIYVSSGVFFWKWIALDAMLIWYLWKYRDDKAMNGIFRPVYGLIGVFAIGYANFFGALHLGWWDSPVNSYFEYEVIDTQGNSYEFSRAYMQPYDMRHAQSRLYFLVNREIVVNTYGTLHSTGAYHDFLASDINDVATITELWGRNRYSENRVRNFIEFLERYFTSYNERLNQVFVPDILRPPMHIWTIPRPHAYNHEFPIETIKVWFIETYDTGDEVVYLNEEVVLEVEIPQDYITSLDGNVRPQDYVIGFTNTTYLGDNSDEYSEVADAYVTTQIGTDAVFIPSQLETREELETYIQDILYSRSNVILSYQPNDLPENFDIMKDIIEELFAPCDIVVDDARLFAQRYVDSALSCDHESEPIEYDNGIIIQDKFIDYDDRQDNVRVVTNWQVNDASLLDDYNVSIQIVTPDWQNVGQTDRHLYDEIVPRYWADLSTEGLPTGDYRVMVIVYHNETGEKVAGTDLTTEETATLLPIGVFTIEDS